MAPDDSTPPSLEEFRTLEAQAHAELARYSRKDRGIRAVAVDRLCREIHRAFEERDTAKVLQRVGQLREIVDELGTANRRVQPPVEDLDEMVSQCTAILQHLPEESSINLREIRECVAKNAAVAHEAADRVPPDQPLYSRCFENIARYREALAAEYQRLNPPTPEDEAVSCIMWADALYAQAPHVALGPHVHELMKEARGRIDEARALLEKGKARQAFQVAAQAAVILKQIARREMPFD